MSSGPDPDQVALLLSELANVTNFRVLPQIAETMVFAVYTVLICVSTYVLAARGLKPWPNRIMLATTLVMYVVTAANWAIDIQLLLNELKVYLPLLIKSGVNADVNSLLELNIVLVLVGSSIADIVIFLGDAIVLWRACVVWGYHRGIVGVSAFLLFSMAVSWIVDILAATASDVDARIIRPLAAGKVVTAMLALSFSVVVNVWSKVLISFKAWQHRRDIQLYLQNRSRKNSVENILTLFAESGAVYSALWIIFLLSEVPDLTPTVFSYFFGSVMTYVTGIYPTLVIIIVALQKSHLDHQFSYPELDTNGTLSFGARVPQTAMHSGTQPSVHVMIPVKQNASNSEAVDRTDSDATSSQKGGHEV